MVIISFIGIILGVAVFIFCAFRGINLTLGALLASIVILAFSGTNIITGITETWMSGVSGSLKKFMLIFVLGTVYGKLAEAGGSSRKIAYSLVSVLRRSKKNEKFFAAYFVPLFYFILTYVGISGMVVIFTVMSIGRELFQELNIPWRFYCYSVGGVLMGTLLGGSLAIANVSVLSVCGTTSTAAGMGLSIVATLIFLVVHAALCFTDIRKAERSGEGFMETGSEVLKVKMEDGLTKEELPNLILAILPMLVMVVLCAVFSVQVELSLVIGILLCIICYYKNLKKQVLTAVISNGIVASLSPLINVCASAAVGTVIKAVVGFTVVTNIMSMFAPLYSGVGLGVLGSIIVASSTSTVPAFGSMMHEAFTQAGLSAGVSHRLLVIATNVASIPPHNAAVVNASSVAKIPYKKAAWIYGKCTFVPGIISLIISVILINLGVFV